MCEKDDLVRQAVLQRIKYITFKYNTDNQSSLTPSHSLSPPPSSSSSSPSFSSPFATPSYVSPYSSSSSSSSSSFSLFSSSPSFSSPSSPRSSYGRHYDVQLSDPTLTISINMESYDTMLYAFSEKMEALL